LSQARILSKKSANQNGRDYADDTDMETVIRNFQRVIRGYCFFRCAPLCPLCETLRVLDLATVRCEQFAACLNQDFEIVFTDGTLPVRLSEARPLGVRPESIREPFSLTFAGRAGLRLPQNIYKLRHATLGEMEIFLVQIAADQTSSTFEAVFN
jgi:hypothetical protein